MYIAYIGRARHNFFLNGKDFNCSSSNDTSPAKSEGLSAESLFYKKP
jgi:hypothetical protein